MYVRAGNLKSVCEIVHMNGKSKLKIEINILLTYIQAPELKLIFLLDNQICYMYIRAIDLGRRNENEK